MRKPGDSHALLWAALPELILTAAQTVRGSAHSSSPHPFQIAEGGIQIAPGAMPDA